MSDNAERAEKLADGDDELGQLLNRAGEIKDRLDENNGDIADLRQQFSEVKAAINEQQAEKERIAQDAERAQMRADLDALLSSTRQASTNSNARKTAWAPLSTSSPVIAIAGERSHQAAVHATAATSQAKTNHR